MLIFFVKAWSSAIHDTRLHMHDSRNVYVVNMPVPPIACNLLVHATGLLTFSSFQKAIPPSIVCQPVPACTDLIASHRWRSRRGDQVNPYAVLLTLCHGLSALCITTSDSKLFQFTPRGRRRHRTLDLFLLLSGSPEDRLFGVYTARHHHREAVHDLVCMIHCPVALLTCDL